MTEKSESDDESGSEQQSQGSMKTPTTDEIKPKQEPLGTSANNSMQSK